MMEEQAAHGALREDSAGNAPVAAEAAGGSPEAAIARSDDAPSATSEADRLFTPPTAEQAAHALRELDWSEHFVATRMAAARGNMKVYLYSLHEAAMFFFDENSGGASLSSSGAFAWLDIDEFRSWIRNVIGDAEFADVLDRKLSAHDTYNDQVETLRHLLMLRFSQYAPFLSQDDETAKETNA